MRRRTRRNLIAAIAAIVVIVIVVALASGGSDDKSSTKASASGAPLVVDVASAPASLDPPQTCSLQDIGLISDLYVTLVKHGTKPGPDGTQQEDPTKLEPYLADSWKVSDGGKTYTFKLRSGAKFPSGTPTDAAAVKYTIERNLASGACGAYFASAGGTGKLISSVEAPDATTVVIKTTRPEPLLLQALTSPVLGIVDPSVVKAHGGDKPNQPNRWMATHAAGSGPYTLESYAPGTKAVYVANPTYFGDAPRTKRVEINFIGSDSTLLLQAREGKADVTLGLAAKSVASLKGSDKVKIVATPQVAAQIVSLPNKSKPFDNATFREALSYAVPYEDILDRVVAGYGELYYGPLPPALPQANAKLQAPRPTDLAKAKQLVAKSGVKGPVALDLIVRSGDADGQQIATIVQDAWKPLGVDVKVKQLSAAQYANAVQKPKRDYSLVRFDGPAIVDPQWLLNYDLRCDAVFNTSNYCSAPAEKLLDQAAVSTDTAQKQQLWDQITKIWTNDSPRIPVYAPKALAVLKNDVKHYVFQQEDLSFHAWGR